MFIAWPKIPRYDNDTVVITEKIDGTNGCIAIHNDGTYHVQSRNNIITPEKDNAGFARWVQDNWIEIQQLGSGYHYGEWWGGKIQRGYGVHKQFSLFNCGRWNKGNLPECLNVVPILYEGILSLDVINMVRNNLIEYGSKAAPGYMKPEGFCIYYVQSKIYQKVIIDK
jgi:hypothetical protein